MKLIAYGSQTTVEHLDDTLSIGWSSPVSTNFSSREQRDAKKVVVSPKRIQSC